MQHFLSTYNITEIQITEVFVVVFCCAFIVTKRLTFYNTLFSFMDKSHNSLLRELFIGSLNEADISPESNYVQTLQISV